MMLGMYKKQLKRDAIVTIDLIYHSVLCLYGKEIENDRRNCGFILYKYVQQSITFNTFLDAVEQNMADNCRNVGNPEKLDCCCFGSDPISSFLFVSTHAFPLTSSEITHDIQL